MLWNMRKSEVPGWLLWNTTRALAVLGFAILTASTALFVWRMFEVGFAWAAWLVIGLAALLAFFSLRKLWKKT